MAKQFEEENSVIGKGGCALTKKILSGVPNSKFSVPKKYKKLSPHKCTTQGGQTF